MKLTLCSDWLVLALTASSVCQYCDAFSLPSTLSRQQQQRQHTSSSSLPLTTLFAKKRKAKKTQKAEKTRPDSMADKLQSAKTGAAPPSQTKLPVDPDATTDESEKGRQQRALEAQQRMDERPQVSTMIVDEETGMEIVAQGKSVMDVVTRKAVVLSNMGPDYRLAQMFPGVPPDVRQKHRLDWTNPSTDVPHMVEALRRACSVQGQIPEHPSVTNTGIDFVLANRDLLSHKMKRTLGRLQMKAMAEGNKEQALANQKLWKNFLTLENHISAPFRQIIMDAEGRVGPNFGNLDLMSFCDGHLYERTANYLVLKGMVAHWEKKVIDADYVEKTPQTKENYMTVLAHGDPKRYLPDPPILFSLKECTQVCYMAQQMTKTFVETPQLFDDLPVEVRFLEQALTIKGGTALRQFVVQDFCPAEGITPEGLREGLKRLYAQLENMQIDPYADLCNILEKLVMAMSVGTDDERDPYAVYLANTDRNGPGAFPTYTFNHEKLSLVRFLDGQYSSARKQSTGPSGGGGGGGGLGGFFNFGGAAAPAAAPAGSSSSGGNGVEKDGVYKVPDARAAGRPHELGWLDLLNDEKDPNMRLGKVPEGRIISE